MIRVLLADDHKILRQGLRTLLEQEADIDVVGEADNGRASVKLAGELAPDVVIMDVAMPDLNGIDATHRITEADPGARVLALSMHSDGRYVKGMLYENPKALHRLLDTLAESVVAYLNAQIEAGAQAVMIFDTWGGALSPEAYRSFSLDYMQQIVSQLKRSHDGQTIPVTLFTKGGAQWIEATAATGCDAIGLDWTINIDEARRRVGDKVALQGNMDPCTLYASPDVISDSVKKIMNDFGANPGHVFNLGHGIHPAVNPDHLGVVIDTVHETGREIRAAAST